MSDPSRLVFELCTAIDRFYERDPPSGSRRGEYGSGL
jgi:hypothetical protein